MSEANGEDVVLDDWAKSKTKAILESMIIKGEIPEDDWPPAHVYELKDEFNKHPALLCMFFCRGKGGKTKLGRL